MSDIHRSIALQHIEDGAWSLAAETVTGGEQPAQIAWRALFAATWWFNHAHAEQLLQTVPDKLNNPGAIFARTLAQIALGDMESIHEALSLLKKKAPQGAWFSRWLILEHMGRAGDYRRQAESLALGLKRFGDQKLPDWIFLACFRGLDRPGIDPEPMLTILKSLGDRRPDWGNALLARLTGQGINDLSGPIKNNSALSYYILEALESGQTDIVPSLFEKLLYSGGANYAVISRCLAFMLNLEMLPPNSRIEKHLTLTLPNEPGLRGSLASFFLIDRWIRGDVAGAYKIIQENREFLNITLNDTNRGSWIFFSYILSLCVFWQKHTPLYRSENRESLTVIGESHSLSPARTEFRLRIPALAKAKFIMGVKMHHLGGGKKNYRKSIFKYHINDIPENKDILVTVGEIDCRIKEGIWPYSIGSGRAPSSVSLETVKNYVNFLRDVFIARNPAQIFIQGIPAPAHALEGLNTADERHAYLGMVRHVNDVLKAEVIASGWSFLDVYAATVGEDGRSDGEWHLDGYHLKPSFYQQADRWLVRPAP